MTDASLNLSAEFGLEEIPLFPNGQIEIKKDSGLPKGQERISAALAALAELDSSKLSYDQFAEAQQKALREIQEGRLEEIDQRVQAATNAREQLILDNVISAELDFPQFDSTEVIRGAQQLKLDKETEEAIAATKIEGVNTLRRLFASEPEFAKHLAIQAERGDTEDQIATNVSKMLIANEINNKIMHEKGWDEQGDASRIFDFITSPFFELFRGEKSIRKFFTPGNAKFEERLGLWKLPPKEFAKAYEEFARVAADESGATPFTENSAVFLSAIDDVRNMRKDEIYGDNLWRVVDFADVGFAAFAALKLGTRGIPALLKSTGNPKLAASVTADKLASAVKVPAAELGTSASARGSRISSVVHDEIVDINDALEYLTGQGYKSDVSLAQGAPGEVLEAIQEREAIAKVIEDTAGSPRTLTEEEFNLALEDKRKLLEADDADPSIVDFVLKEGTSPLDPNTISSIHGTLDGGSFRNIAVAKRAARQRGLKEFQVVQLRNSDGYYIKTDAAFNEAKYVTALDESEIGKVGPIGARLRAATAFASGRTVSEGQLASAQVSEGLKQISTHLLAPIERLKKQERLNLEAVAQFSQEKQRWLSYEGLDNFYKTQLNRTVTDAEVEAYYAYKSIDEMVWRIENKIEYRRKLQEGWSTVRIEGAPKALQMESGATARVIEPSEEAMSRLYDNRTRKFVLPGEHYNTLDEFKNYLLENNLKVVKLAQARRLDEEHVTYVLAYADEVTVDPLHVVQVGYTAGGRRIPEGKIFIKQPNTYTSKVDGITYALNPLTYAAFKSRKEAKAWVDQLEIMRKAALDAENYTDIQLDEIFSQSPVEELNTYDAFMEAVNDKLFRIDAEFGVYADKETPRVGAEIADASNPTLPSSIEWLHREQRAIKRKRGRNLLRGDGEKGMAIYTNPFAATDSLISRVADTLAWENFRTTQITRWAQGAKPYLVEGSNFNSPLELFLRGELVKKGVARGTIEKFEAERLAIKRMLRFKTQGDEWHESYASRLAQWVDGRKVGFWTMNETDALGIFSNKPENALKAFAYHWTLGMFDVGQLALQTHAAAQAVVVAPKFGLQAIDSYPLVRWSLVNGTPEFKSHAAKVSAKFSGLSEKEFVTMIDQLKKSNYYHVAGEQVIMGYHQSGMALTAGRKGVRAVKDWGTIPYREAELINKITTWGIAFRRFKQQFPNESLDSRKALNWMVEEANRLNMDMSDVSASAANRGITGLATQFLTYPKHLMEAVLPEMMGGSGKWTAAEKTRLAFAQVLLTGTVGTGGTYGKAAVDYIANQIGEATDQTGNQLVNQNKATQFMYNFVANGMFDSLYPLVTDGTPTALNLRTGTGLQIEHMLVNMAEKGVLQSLFPSVDIIANAAHPSIVAAHTAFSMGGEMSGEEWLSLAKMTLTDTALSASGLKRTWTALDVAESGKLKDSNGEPIANSKGWADVFSTAIGAKHSFNREAVFTYLSDKEMKADIKSIANEVAAILKRAEDNPDSAKLYREMGMARVRHLSPEIQQKVLSQALRKHYGIGFVKEMQKKATVTQPENILLQEGNE